MELELLVFFSPGVVCSTTTKPRTTLTPLLHTVLGYVTISCFIQCCFDIMGCLLFLKFEINCLEIEMYSCLFTVYWILMRCNVKVVF